MSTEHPPDRHVYNSAKNLADLYRLIGEVYGERPALAWKEGGEYRSLTFRELYDRGATLGTALIELGLQPREHVALLADNRPEWLVCDSAILMAGTADVFVEEIERQFHMNAGAIASEVPHMFPTISPSPRRCAASAWLMASSAASDWRRMARSTAVKPSAAASHSGVRPSPSVAASLCP
jgi:non-ribosomal peptide synthetase component F